MTKLTIIIMGIALAVLFTLIMYCCCVVAGREDEQMARLWQHERQRQDRTDRSEELPGSDMSNEP